MRSILFIIALLTMTQSTLSAPRSLLDDSAKWEALFSDGVTAKVAREGKSLRIDFDFTQGAGYGGAVLDWPIDLPANYQFTMNVRGEGPANNLEFKLVDPSKLNVWWVNRRGFEWPTTPTRLVNQKRHFQFAWGPSGGAEMKQLGRLEIIIAANEGGKGTVWIDDLSFTELPPAKPYKGKPTITATSGDSAKLDEILSGNGEWRASTNDREPKLTIDFAEPREIGGVFVSGIGGPPMASLAFDAEISDDGATWKNVRSVTTSSILPAELAIPDLQTRYLRLAFKPSGAAPSIKSIKFLEPADTATPNAFWKMRAARAARGLYPRNLLNEQSYWTVIGQSDDAREALINEEGMIELDRRGFSIEPFILRDGKLLTWADGKHQQSLRDGWIPIPSVVRTHDGIELSVTAIAAGEKGSSTLHAAYTIRNTSTQPTRGKLVLAVRPLQVLPPWQDLNITGGWTPVRSIRRNGDALVVNDSTRDEKHIVAEGYALSAQPFDGGDVVELLATGTSLPVFAEANAQQDTLVCPQRSASAAMLSDFDLAPGASTTRVISAAFDGERAPMTRPLSAADFETLSQKVAADWARQINTVTFRLPPSAKQFHDTLRSTQAYILINHDTNGFQPGSRTYNRSWMRDGSMTSAAMLELGHDDLVKKFIDWYAPYQFPSGKVPCVVDARGADPVPEHDSHGQLIWLIANAHRYTRDSDLVHRHFDRVKKAVEYIESLRAERMTEEFGETAPPRQEPNKPPVPAIAFRGLVPESISHEGYSAKPMHSFWDTLFVLRGLRDSVYLAQVMNEPALAARWQKLTDEFRDSIISSIRIAHKAHGIDYLPGCVELGDFDSTSSTILLWPVEETANFPREWVEATFERYWSEFTKRENSTTWDAYTPYELRHVNALVRMGRKDRAWHVLNWYFAHQRPAGWRHWAEVVWREPTTPKMIGDMPHTWVGSDFLNAARTMFVYEDHHDQKLILLGGVPDEWFTDPAGVGFENLRTEFGPISVDARGSGNKVTLRLTGTATPPGGFEIRSPLSKKIVRASMDGNALEMTAANSVVIKSLPATIEIEY